jgi:hypothetical protein
MNYIKKTAYGIEVSKHKKIETHALGLLQYINQLCVEVLTTYQGRIEALKKKFHLKNNVPIYIHKGCCLFYLEPLRNLEVIVINMVNVRAITKEGVGLTKIMFHDGSSLSVPFKDSHVLKRFSQSKSVFELIHD